MRTYILIFCSLCLTQSVWSQNLAPLPNYTIDSLVNASLKAFDVPGIALGIIKNGKLILAKGYGVRSLKTQKPMDENTLFGIASNSKAFTTTALGILVDEGKLHWDDKVRDYIPEIKFYNPYVTEEFTIRDLLTHRSGMGLGAGDLMFFPDSSNFSFADMVYNLRFLKSVSCFRTKYDYDNLLYIVAGEVVHRVSGKTWDDFVTERILNPLGMTNSATSYARLTDKSNVIDAHAKYNGRVHVIPRHVSSFDGPAGGIYSNITDLSKWVIMHLNDGVYGPDGTTLLSKENHAELWTPQTIIPIRNPGPYNSHFGSYGLGFFLSDVKGYKQATHTGGLDGMVTEITMIPELKLGIIVLTNGEEGGAFRSVTNQIKDYYLGIKGNKWVETLSKARAANVNGDLMQVDQVWRRSDSIAILSNGYKNLKTFLGTYTDAWMGEVRMHIEKGQYRLDFTRSPKLSGQVFPYLGNAALVKWDRRNMDADAFMVFNLDENGKPVSMTMKPISGLTDFSYDFQDLFFRAKTK